jgi:hypothetical protein
VATDSVGATTWDEAMVSGEGAFEHGAVPKSVPAMVRFSIVSVPGVSRTREPLVSPAVNGGTLAVAVTGTPDVGTVRGTVTENGMRTAWLVGVAPEATTEVTSVPDATFPSKRLATALGSTRWRPYPARVTWLPVPTVAGRVPVVRVPVKPSAPTSFTVHVMV